MGSSVPVLVLVGCGINLGALPKSLGFGAANWMLTAFGWGMAVFVGASGVASQAPT